MERKQVSMHLLPSKGKMYPQESEIFVSPLTLRDQIEMDRVTVTYSEYQRTLLNGIECIGFPKTKLLLGDAQYLDLVRRMLTKGDTEELQISCPCPNTLDKTCDNKEVQFRFYSKDVTFIPYKKEMFKSREIEGENIVGKEYTFSDGTTFIASPVTLQQSIDIAVKYISNAGVLKESEVDIAYYAYSVNGIVGRQFKDIKALREFTIDYFSNLYKLEDLDKIEELSRDILTVVKPFVLECPSCGEQWEVNVKPSTSFR